MHFISFNGAGHHLELRNLVNLLVPTLIRTLMVNLLEIMYITHGDITRKFKNPASEALEAQIERSVLTGICYHAKLGISSPFQGSEFLISFYPWLSVKLLEMTQRRRQIGRSSKKSTRNDPEPWKDRVMRQDCND